MTDCARCGKECWPEGYVTDGQLICGSCDSDDAKAVIAADTKAIRQPRRWCDYCQSLNQVFKHWTQGRMCTECEECRPRPGFVERFLLWLSAIVWRCEKKRGKQ